jgi:hypothetical protein
LSVYCQLIVRDTAYKYLHTEDPVANRSINEIQLCLSTDTTTKCQLL